MLLASQHQLCLNTLNRKEVNKRMRSQYALTTFDNPFDPFEQFTSWFLFDEEKGYHSTAYLGRIARTSNALTDEENDKEVERAIDEIIKYDFMNVYRKVTRTLSNNSL